MLTFKTVMIITFLISFFSVVYLAPVFIRRANKRNLVVADMYKKDKRKIPTIGGLLMIAAIMLALVFLQFFTRLMVPLQIFYFVALTYALYGLTDDLYGFKNKRVKVFILFVLALPIAILTSDTTINLFLFSSDIGAWYAFLIAPMYLMIVANLINMHAGYNGLAAGTTLIMLYTAFFKSFYMFGWKYSFLLVPLLGALTAFLIFNFYPSRIFMGNVGSFLIGGALGAFLVISNMLWFGVVMLIPHIINFLLWIYWTFNMKKYPHIKFGKLRDDNTIKSPNNLTVKYWVTNKFRVNEWQATLINYGLTFICCIIAYVVF